MQYGINVTSAAQEDDDGQVFSVFKVTTKDGKQVPKVRGVCVSLWEGAFIAKLAQEP